MAKKIVIRKYENRRLYDATNSRYVNLDEVAQMVRDGADVEVVDAATGEDITRLILTQIIVEEAKAPGSAFPQDMLRQMILATGRASQENAVKYMKTMFDMYQDAYRNLPFSPFGFMQNMPGATTPGGSAADGSFRRAEQSAAPGSRPVAPDDVQEMKRRLEEVEATIAGLRNSAAQPGRKSSRNRKRK